jgi:hypothetical protein
MTPAPTASDAEDASAGLPSAGVRTTISFLLFVHLFLLAVGIWGNFGVRTERDVTDEHGSIAAIHGYLSFFNMDKAYNYPLVTGMSDDWDHEVVVALDVPQTFEGTPEELKHGKTIPFTPRHVWPGIRRRRYQMLGLQIAELAADPDSEPELRVPKVLTEGMLHEFSQPTTSTSQGSTRHRFICQAIQTRDLYRDENAPSEPSDPYDPKWITNVIQADVIPAIGAASTEPQWLLIKVVGRGEATRSGPSQRSARPRTEPEKKTAPGPTPPPPGGVTPPRPTGAASTNPIHGDR